jgi:hypothetical protein
MAAQGLPTTQPSKARSHCLPREVYSPYSSFHCPFRILAKQQNMYHTTSTNLIENHLLFGTIFDSVTALETKIESVKQHKPQLQPKPLQSVSFSLSVQWSVSLKCPLCDITIVAAQKTCQKWNKPKSKQKILMLPLYWIVRMCPQNEIVCVMTSVRIEFISIIVFILFSFLEFEPNKTSSLSS